MAAGLGYAAAPALAAGNAPMNLSFQASSGNSASWVIHGQEAQLSVNNSTSSGYAVISLHHFSSTLPTTEPSFTATNYASGTPRIVIFMSNTAVFFIYPNGVVTGSTPTAYATFVAANAGATVAGVFIVADTSQPVPYTTDVTSFQYAGVDLIS